MKNVIFCLIFLLLNILQFSCRRITCQDPALSVYFSGFDSSDLSHIHVVEYEQGTNQIIRDEIVNLNDPARISSIVLNYHSYDYSITVMNLNKEYKLTNFHTKQRKANDGKLFGEADACSNDVYYKENGQDRVMKGMNVCMMEDHCVEEIQLTQ